MDYEKSDIPLGIRPAPGRAVYHLEGNTQASRIFKKFGGAPNLIRALAKIGKPRDSSTVYRWDLPRAVKGTDGLIPPIALQDVLDAATAEGIELTDADLNPRRQGR